MQLPIPAGLLAQAVDQLHDGLTIADADKPGYPLIYVNAGFEQLTGYTSAELMGQSVRLLQGTDTEQPEIATLRDALHQGENCVVTLRNYRRDGSMFWNELSLSPVRNDAGAITHYIGIQKDVTERVLHDQHLHQSYLELHTQNQKLMAHTSPLAGTQFDAQLDQMLKTAQRTHTPLSVLILDLDLFGLFNERYGRQAGDACLRMVGERIAKSFGRGSDCVARYNNDEFSVASMGVTREGLQQHMHKLRDQIRALNIPHHDSPDGVVTICAGCVTLVPQRDTTAQALLQRANIALQQAKKQGHNCEHIQNNDLS